MKKSKKTVSEIMRVLMLTLIVNQNKVFTPLELAPFRDAFYTIQNHKVTHSLEILLLGFIAYRTFFADNRPLWTAKPTFKTIEDINEIHKLAPIINKFYL